MIYLIIGERNSGKTRYLKEMIKSLKKTDGFITVKQFEKNSLIGYNLERILTGEKVPFIRFDKRKVNENNILLEYSRKVFLKEGYNFAKRILFEAKKQGYENFIIDEIGKLELEGKVFSGILSEAISYFKNLYIAVRSEFVDEVIKKFKIKEFEKIELERSKDDRFEDKQRKNDEISKEMQGEGNNYTNIEGADKPTIGKKRNKRGLKKDKPLGGSSKESL